MADTLDVDFTFRTEQAPIYWWTIMCDVLASYHFAFNSPDHPAGQSSYTYYRYNPPYTEDIEEIESCIGSFQDVSDEVRAERGSVVALFWQTEGDGESMEMDFGFTPEKEMKRIGVLITIPGGQLRDVQVEKAHARQKHLFACTKALIEACQPETGEIYWETSSFNLTPWAVIGETAEPLFAPHPYCPAIYDDNQRLLKQPLQNGSKTLFYLDPVPVLRRQDQNKYWQFYSLQEEDNT
ncbi:hypothetical protein [Dictyobacter formicarum]|uniref:Uncharacterized protein n=1 Tax=Dictyobacter formicarum TaxID=2778368 RepID=A0ABQ3VUA2_9CHLR|nr:hypothetical protein [Dictyobacter formicarum]GHO89398.1 hypothetical protein KSZ_74040 [Dictyobacter formicarum]